MHRQIVSEHNKNKNDMVQPKTHIEQIECPQCKTIQNATVEHLPPFWSYVHHCEKCKYVIMESEWQKVTNKTTTEMTTEMKEQLKEKMAIAITDNQIHHVDMPCETNVAKAAKACADICKEQEKNTAVAFAEFTLRYKPIRDEENSKDFWVSWQLAHINCFKEQDYLTTEQLFTIFTDNQNG